VLNLEKHPYFEEFIDPATGVKSYILKEKVAKLQLNFYFTEMGLTYDNKYMWFKCIDWPAQNRHLGVMSMDPDNPFIRKFTGASMNSSEPNIIPGTHDALVAIDNSVYRFDVSGNCEKVLEVGSDIIRGRRIDRISTHLSINSDNELMLLDMRIGEKTYIATGNLNTGEVKMIHKFIKNYNHSQFCPTNPKLFLIDQDWEIDPVTGERFDVDQRMWLMDTEGTRLENVLPGNWFRHNNSIICHDFWSKDGYLCWPDLLDSVCEYNIETKEVKGVWNHSICHAHTNERNLWVGDDSPYAWDKRPCRVVFFDRESGKEIDIFSALPKPNYKSTSVYHLDPHPAFTPDNKYIISTVTLKNGEVDVAITPVEPLLELCREKGLKVNDECIALTTDTKGGFKI